MPDEEINRRADQLFEVIERSRNPSAQQRHFHFWYFDESQIRQVDLLLGAYDRWLLHRRPPGTTITTLNSSGLLPIRYDRHPALRATRTYYCVYCDGSFVAAFPDVCAYVDAVAANMLAAGEVGIPSLLHFLVHRNDQELFLEEMFRTIHAQRGLLHPHHNIQPRAIVAAAQPRRDALPAAWV